MFIKIFSWLNDIQLHSYIRTLHDIIHKSVVSLFADTHQASKLTEYKWLIFSETLSHVSGT